MYHPDARSLLAQHSASLAKLAELRKERDEAVGAAAMWRAYAQGEKTAELQSQLSRSEAALEKAREALRCLDHALARTHGASELRGIIAAGLSPSALPETGEGEGK